jgi:TonB family protein
MNRLMQHPRRHRNQSKKGNILIHLNLPQVNFGGKKNWVYVLSFLCVLAVLFSIENISQRQTVAKEEQVQVVEEAPPPLAVIKIPLKTVPVPPDESVPPLPSKETPPSQPVFGLPEEATSKSSDMVVTTGNTLMKPADPVVQKAPPPLPSVPIKIDHQPQTLNKVMPEYPEWAEEQGVTAKVVLLVTIDCSGRVQDFAIQSSGGQDFDKNAIKAVKATKFQPLVKGGISYAAQFLFTYDFRL